MIPALLAHRVIVEPIKGCWLFVGWNSGNGYGKIQVDGKSWMVHRWTYVHVRKLRIPRRKLLDHMCRVRRCCNPWHLRPVTVRENTLLGKTSLLRGKEDRQLELPIELRHLLPPSFYKDLK